MYRCVQAGGGLALAVVSTYADDLLLLLLLLYLLLLLLLLLLTDKATPGNDSYGVDSKCTSFIVTKKQIWTGFDTSQQ